VAYLPVTAAPDGPRWPVTGHPVGDFQGLAGGAAVRRLAAAPGLAGDPGDPGAAVRAAVAAPDRHAAFLDELAARVAIGAAGVCAVLDPGFLVLAGTVGLAGGAALADRVAAGIAALTPLPTEVRTATVAGDPVVRGAVLTALDVVHRELFRGPTGRST
jgi:predicted NBD/HSP70 family sugar kinase